MPNQLIATIHRPRASGSGTVSIPPVIALPVPEFASWADAVAYARGMFARTRYLEAQVGSRVQPGPLVTAVSDAQINLAAATQELGDLLEAARSLLTQGKDLA